MKCMGNKLEVMIEVSERFYMLKINNTLLMTHCFNNVKLCIFILKKNMYFFLA